jgi:acyl carrier protein
MYFMNRSEVKEIVDAVFIDEFEKEAAELKEDADLFEDLELDSLDGIDLVVALEKAVKAKTGKDFKIDEDKAKELKTVGSIYDIIEKSV